MKVIYIVGLIIAIIALILKLYNLILKMKHGNARTDKDQQAIDCHWLMDMKIGLSTISQRCSYPTGDKRINNLCPQPCKKKKIRNVPEYMPSEAWVIFDGIFSFFVTIITIIISILSI